MQKNFNIRFLQGVIEVQNFMNSKRYNLVSINISRISFPNVCQFSENELKLLTVVLLIFSLKIRVLWPEHMLNFLKFRFFCQ